MLAREVTTEAPADAKGPETGDEVKVHYTGYLAACGTKFDSSRDRGRVFSFLLGTGQVIPAWDEGVAQMKKGERCMLRVPAEMGYGESGAGNAIPPDADLDFDVELLDFGPKKKETWELTAEERVQEATSLKEEGNQAFKSGDYAWALEKYEKIREVTDNDGGQFDSQKEGSEATDAEALNAQRLDLRLSCFLNMAMCFMKLEDWRGGFENSRLALELDEKNEKALFRKITCAIELEEVEAAKADLKQFLSIAPKSVQARGLHKSLQEKLAMLKKRDKATFGSLFQKSMYNDKFEPMRERDLTKGEFKKVYMDVQFGERTEGEEDSEEKSKEGEESEKKEGEDSEEKKDSDKKSLIKRVTFALYNDIVPKTCENFLRLCKGEEEDKSLTFKDSSFHRVIKGFMLQGGDFTKGDGTGGMSIYGERFADENLTGDRHHKRYQLSMANCGPNTNGSQFFVTFAAAPHLDGKHVVFGEVIDGFDVVDLIEECETGDADKPVEDLKIVGCGVVEGFEAAESKEGEGEAEKKEE